MSGFRPPPYPYDRLDQFKPYGDAFEGGLLNFSIGTPHDPPPATAVEALGSSDAERGYPPSVGSSALRSAMCEWIERRLGVHINPDQVAATVGSKEFVATLPQWMKLRTPERDVVLYPATAYPSYAMGATLAGCTPVPVPEHSDGTMNLGAVSTEHVERALLLWCNSPSNPTGVVSDLGAIVAWGRAHRIPVFSDECYVDFLWDGPPQSALQSGLDGVVSVFSLSKRSNFAGVRIGFFAGDPELVHYLGEVRKHAGLMPPGPSQAAAVVALGDEHHVEHQRTLYRRRLEMMADVMGQWLGSQVDLPSGTFYLWIPVDDAWAVTERLAREGGALVTPGEFFGDLASRNIRIAVVQSEGRIEMLARRLGQT